MKKKTGKPVRRKPMTVIREEHMRELVGAIRYEIRQALRPRYISADPVKSCSEFKPGDLVLSKDGKAYLVHTSPSGQYFAVRIHEEELEGTGKTGVSIHMLPIDPDGGGYRLVRASTIPGVELKP